MRLPKLLTHPYPKDVEFAPEGIRLRWGSGSLEAKYIGTELRWSDVRDVDVDAAPPEIRLRDGRTAFVPATLRDELTQAATHAEVPFVHRPDVWSALLEPFLDTDYAIIKDRTETSLQRWGFQRDEVRRIRRRCAARMMMLTAVTWEWAHYGQADLLMAKFALGLPTPSRSWRYRRYRRWTDRLADRPTRGGSR